MDVSAISLLHTAGGFYNGCVTVYRRVSVVDDLAHEITVK